MHIYRNYYQMYSKSILFNGKLIVPKLLNGLSIKRYCMDGISIVEIQIPLHEMVNDNKRNFD